MSSQEIISLAINAGCEVIDYGDHYCVKKHLDINVVVTIPKVTHLIAQLVEKVKATLGL
ncbi:MAG: hypothetical protein ACLT21_06590 [Oscillospiraceae bacterium]